MRLLERLTLQLRADAHGVMDRLEERSLLIRQHLREAELELDRKRAHLEASDEEQRRLEEQVEREERQVASLDADVEIALGGDNADLARFAIRRLLPRRRALAALRERIEELVCDRERRAAQLEIQEEQLSELRERVRARLAVDEQGFVSPWLAEEAVPDEEVELELLRRRGATDGRHG